MSRDMLLGERAIAITKQLERWAKQKKILNPGEQITFTLSIVTLPLVTRSTSTKGLLDMRPLDFFTEKRFHEAHVPTTYHLERARNFLKDCDYRALKEWEQENGHPSLDLVGQAKHNGCPDLRTVRDLVAAGTKRLAAAVKVGNKTIGAMARVLAHNGIVVTEFGE